MTMEVTYGSRARFILFGDSITQLSFDVYGWGAALANHYARKVDVVLRGYGGYNTRLALHMLEKIFPLTSPDPPHLVTVFFGANDAAIPDSGGNDQYLPIPEYKDNLRKIIAHLKEVKTKHIVVISPPPVDDDAFQANANFDTTEGLPERTNDHARLYAEAAESVARETGVLSLNVWSLFHQTADWKKFLNDGLHLSHEGNQELFKRLLDVLENPALKPSLHWKSLPWDYPEHHSIDYKDLASSFRRVHVSTSEDI